MPVSKFPKIMLGLGFTSSLFISSTLQGVFAQSTAVPIDLIAFPSPSQRNRVANFIVPDRDPRGTSAYGGQLSRYDVHIAKMYEITDYQCLDSVRSGHVLERIIWRYYAGGRSIKMGAYTIHCQEARIVAGRYGLGKPEPTKILYYRARATINIPILDITGSKVGQWKEFVNTLQPEGMD